jgi:integrase
LSCNPQAGPAIVLTANTGAPVTVAEMERMARRRFQDPKPILEGNFWYLRVWQNAPGVARKRERIKLAPASTPEREVLKMAAERLRPVNRGLITVGSAVNFMTYVEGTYIPTELPLLAKGVQRTYQAMIRKHLNPAFGDSALRDLTPLTLQRFFSGMPARDIAYPTIVKVRDALSSVLRSAVRYEFLERNPLEKLQLPPDKRGELDKPLVSPVEFQSLILLVPEPYASMIYVAVWTGLRVRELSALKWKCIHADSIAVKQRYSRGDWSSTKTPASAATIAVDPHVIARIHHLKTLTVDVRAGRAVRHHKVVKNHGPEDLVFQSVWQGKPMNASNVLKRFIAPAAEKLKLSSVDWRCLRRSCATWMAQAGANPKDIQGQMRHSRISTTMDIYAQFVPEGQKRAARKLTEYVDEQVKQSGPIAGPLLVQ